jgi:hypothetical protein
MEDFRLHTVSSERGAQRQRAQHPRSSPLGLDGDPAATGRLLDIMAILRHTGGAALSADDIARRLPEPALGFELYPALVRLEAEGLVARFEVSRSRLGSRRS